LILEALPSIAVGIGVLYYLTNFPRQARWLRQRRDRLAGGRPGLREAKQGISRTPFVVASTDRSANPAMRSGLFCIAGNYGVAFFLPTIIKGLGATNTQTGFLTALPFVFGAFGMVLFGLHSDRTKDGNATSRWRF
jgi:hypothetical protein